MEAKIVIKTTDAGIMVYNDTTKDRIDLFENNPEGITKLISYVKDIYGKDVTDFFN